jgi:subtilase family serine protease
LISFFISAISFAVISQFFEKTQAAELQMIQRHLPSAVKFLRPLSRLSGENHLNLVIGLPLRNQAGLSNLLEAIYDPASPNYHHYLTPEQFTGQFGPTESDYQAVSAFAGANNLQITGTHKNRLLLDVNGGRRGTHPACDDADISAPN